jgi:hypothetical protein
VNHTAGVACLVAGEKWFFFDYDQTYVWKPGDEFKSGCQPDNPAADNCDFNMEGQ